MIGYDKNLTTGKNCRLEVIGREEGYKIKFGSDVQINDNVHIAAASLVEIGHNVLIASRVFITDHDHGFYSGNIQSKPFEVPVERPLNCANVKINDRVWIGEGACIMKGVTIGEGSIVGANSVVTKSVPDNSIVVGIPGKVIRSYDETNLIWKTTK